MADNSRIEDLRRRVQKDPASIAFAQLAEEYRRAGQYQDAVEACRAGLAIHPGYLSARVTLGRALLELRDLDGARAEFELVLKSAPENLAAVRGLAEVFHRRGDLDQALVQYRAALNLARNDPDLEQTVDDLTRQVGPKKSPEGRVQPGEVRLKPDTTEIPLAAPAIVAPPPAPALVAPPPAPAADAVPEIAPAAEESEEETVSPPAPAETAVPSVVVPAPIVPIAAAPAPADTHVQKTIEALEQWLDAIHVSRSDRSS
jgi:tetratricopeptide (TPR) repeat protein